MKKKIKKHVLPYVFLTAILILIIWFNTAWSDLSILHFKPSDDVVWYYTLVRMYEGILHFDIKEVFSYPLIYGFIFFLTKLLVVFPFLDDVGSPLSVVLPNIVTSFIAGATLYYILKATRLQKYTTLEQIILLSLIILMPGFWYGTGLIHPEFMMTCFLCASIYYLGSSKSLYSRGFWKGIVLWGFAVGTKLTAVTFAPAVLGMVIWKWKNKEIGFQAALSCLAAIGGVILGLFVILTPYLIYPPGAMKWWNSMSHSLGLNVTNTGGWIGLVSLQEKVIKGVGAFFPLSLFIVVLISAIWSIAKAWKTEELTVNTLIALYVLPYTLYLLFTDSITWSGYYLPPMLLGASLITSAVKEIKAVKKLKTVAVILLFAAVLIQGYSFGGSFIERIVLRMDDKMLIKSRSFPNKELVVEKRELLRIAYEDAALIKPYVDTDTVLCISAFTISDYSTIGLTHDKVVTVFGLLSEGYFNREKNPSDLIVISKKEPYFSEEWLSKMTNQADWRQAKQLIEGWLSGRGEFTLVDQNARLLIFQRKKFSGKS